MHLVLDMQGAQVRGRYPEACRAVLALVRALARTSGENRITLVLSGLFPETIQPIIAALAGAISENDIRIWQGIGPTADANLENTWCREVSERLREAFLATLRPDVVLVTNCFEGYDNDAIFTVDLATKIPTAALILAPLPQFDRAAQQTWNFAEDSWYRRRLASLAKCGRILAATESSRRELATALHFEVNRVINVGLAGEPSFRDLGLTEEERIHIRAAHGMQRPCILHAGCANSPEFAATLVKAWLQLEQTIKDRYQLAFIGNYRPQDIGKLQALASSGGLNEGDICFLGDLSEPDLIRLYNACALLVLPPLSNGLYLPAIEAMACGLPVVAANTADALEVLGLDAALFDPLSINAVTEKLRDALTDASLRSQLIVRGKLREAEVSGNQSARLIWRELVKLRGVSYRAASPLVNVDRSGIFRKRHLKILVTKLDHLGDFILSIPALSKLRARYPDAEIDIVVGSWNIALVKTLKYFRNVFAFDFFKRKSSEQASASNAELSTLLQAMDVYDFAIDLRRQPDSRFFLLKVNAHLRIGYQTFDQSIDERLDIMLRAYKEGAHVRTPHNQTPISKQILHLVDALPADVNDFVSLPEISGGARREPGRVAIFPKAGTDAREWDPEKIRQLVDKFLALPAVKDLQLFFISEAEAAQYGFAESARMKVNIGLGFPELVQLLASSNLCIANNSGGVHLASYLGVPTIGIFSGHELSAEWGPQFHDSVVIHRGASCAPCHLGSKADCPYDNFCLRDIAVEDVFRKSMEVLAANIVEIDGPALSTASVGLQRSDEEIVRHLIAELGALSNPDGPQRLLQVSTIIAHNHPTYSSLSDTDFAYDKLVNTILNHRSTAIEWVGFGSAEREYRWTDGRQAAMHFYLEGEIEVPPFARLLLVFDTYKRQRVGVKFNSMQVCNVEKSGKRILLSLPVKNLRYGLNRLELLLPDAVSPGTTDTRELGMAVRTLKIVVEDENASIFRRTARWADPLIRLR
jgi:ADP-heptose:LPS heptosyltransferase